MHETIARKEILSPGDYEAFQNFLQNACGILLGAGKEYLVSSRLSSLMRHYDIATVGELLNQLQHGRNPQLKSGIIDAMTTNETFWFRDMAHFNLLERRVLPETSRSRPHRLRIWSAACSSGQEPYNISMVVEDFRQRNPGSLRGPVEIVATDISQRILEEARRGVYCGISASRGLSAEQSRRYFNRNGDCLEVRPEIKRQVSFRNANLTKGYELLGRFDAIFCRNVLIYFSRQQKQDILERMARILNPGGYLLLGSTESISGHSDQFEMISESGGIIYRLK
ncbi:MAG: protein-glutamate O-methyltransferase CheR [Gammaproteobacteria bacterium]|nr:protein-glutamate O-methyltransferase CheR [Gammaproteobacteria bacterium]